MNCKLFIYIFALFVICTPKFLFKKNFMLQDLLYSAIFTLLFFLTYDLVESIQKEGMDDYKIKVDGANYLSSFLRSFSNDDDPVKISINNKVEGPVKETIYRDITPLVESQPAPEPQPKLSTPSLLSSIFTPSPQEEPTPPAPSTTPITDNNIKGAVNEWVADKDKAITKYGDIKDWDTSAVTDMSGLFSGKGNFNDDISKWNTSNVTRMNSMFQGAYKFNQNIGSWNTSKVKHMDSMWNSASSFNQDIGSWNTSSVLSMNTMFGAASSFNQSTIRNWDVSNVTDMRGMFGDATKMMQNQGAPETPTKAYFYVWGEKVYSVPYKDRWTPYGYAICIKGRVHHYQFKGMYNKTGKLTENASNLQDAYQYYIDNPNKFTEIGSGMNNTYMWYNNNPWKNEGYDWTKEGWGLFLYNGRPIAAFDGSIAGKPAEYQGYKDRSGLPTGLNCDGTS